MYFSLYITFNDLLLMHAGSPLKGIMEVPMFKLLQFNSELTKAEVENNRKSTERSISFLLTSDAKDDFVLCGKVNRVIAIKLASR